MKELFGELPELYEIVFGKLRNNQVWNLHHLDNLKMIWNSMTMSEVYNVELMV